MKTCTHKGAAGETFCASWFLQKGFEVFLNIPAAGPADLVVWNTETGRLVPVDVKTRATLTYRADGLPYSNRNTDPRIREDGVAQITWIPGEPSPRLPEGFWEILGIDPTNDDT